MLKIFWCFVMLNFMIMSGVLDCLGMVAHPSGLRALSLLFDVTLGAYWMTMVVESITQYVKGVEASC